MARRNDMRTYSLKTLADHGLGERSWIFRRAKTLGLKFTYGIVNGKKIKFYLFDFLPPEWQVKINQAEESARKSQEYQNALRLIEEAKLLEANLPLDDEDYGHLWAYYERKPDKTKQEAMRKLKAVQAYEALIYTKSARKMEAIATVAAEFGEHPNTLRNWLKRVKDIPVQHRLPCLIDGYTGRTAKAECSPEAWDFVKADWLRPAKPAFAAVYNRLERAAAEHGWIIPHIRTLERRLLKELPREVIILARQGADALKKCYPPQERDHGVFHALEAVNGDGYTFWPYVDFGAGLISKATAWIWQDIFSGKLLSYRVDVSECTEVVRLATGDLVETYGIPEKFWLDNTMAAANKTMTGGVANRFRFKVKTEDPVGLIPMLGSEVHWCTPGAGQGKPVERAFGRGGLSEYVDKHPAFAGRGTKARPVPLAEFEQILATEIAAFNARTGRLSTVCNGRSFDQMFAESYARSTVRKATAEQRRLWLLACDNVTVDRNSASLTIKFYNSPQGQNRYWDELLSPYAGRKITVRFDPQDLQGTVHCYGLDGRYICAAACCLAAGFNDADAAREHNRLRNRHKKSAKEQLERERRMTALQASTLIPRAEPPAPKPSKVVAPVFGKKTVNADCYETDQDADRFARAVGMMKEEDQRKVRI